jgi:predicted ester cyclase
MKSSAVDAALVLERYKSIWIDGKIDLVDGLFAPDVVRHQPVSVMPQEVEGREAYRAYITEFRGLHPDLSVELSDVIVGGDKIAYRYTASACVDESKTKRFSYTGITIVRLDAEGRITEEWLTWDTFDLLVQVGAVPPREP